MASASEIGAVYVAGSVQGIALVTFPAASTIFTSPSYYQLTNTAYGGLFVPQAVLAVTAALAGAGLSRRWGLKRVLRLGLAGNLLAMVLLLVSQVAMGTPLAYGILLLATACLGVGFGLAVPTLNTLVAAFFPRTGERAVLLLNALLGVGTVLAPVLVAVFIGLGNWAGLPVVVAVLMAGLLVWTTPLPLEVAETQLTRDTTTMTPARFWVFAAFALLYGIVETINGNWASLYMVDLGASTTLAALALTAFWGSVTVGRIGFALIERVFPATRTFHLLPFVAAIALGITSLLPSGSPEAGLLAFALAGLGCSALLPLTISFGQSALTVMGAGVAGGLIAAYQIGYGLAAFGVGPLERLSGLDLRDVYALAAGVALALAALSFVVVPRRPVASAPVPAE